VPSGIAAPAIAGPSRDGKNYPAKAIQVHRLLRRLARAVMAAKQFSEQVF
jgi:hypothetical protein